MNILALNCGSSSLKYQLIDRTTSTPLASGLVERIGLDGTSLKHRVGDAPATRRALAKGDHAAAIAQVLDLLATDLPDRPVAAVGHRVVHGGRRFARSVVIDAEVLAAIEELIPLAPLHNPPNLAGIVAAQALMPGVPQIAVFDTAFHQTMPHEAYTYAVPQRWVEDLDVRSYGFHGTSHLYVSRRAASLLQRPVTALRLITCHVGNGVSVSAVRHGHSIDNSMGLTPLEGAIMGTRAGDLDAGLIPYVQSRTQEPYERIFAALNKESGMLALSGESDLRDVEEGHMRGDARCTEALKAYAYRLKKYIGAYAAALGGVDAVVFTAGVGENSALVRELVLADMEYLGLHLDPDLNRATWNGVERAVSPPDSPVRVLVIPTNEELVIVEDTVALLEGRSPTDPAFRYSFESAGQAAIR